jgi:hypothetical protein
MPGKTSDDGIISERGSFADLLTTVNTYVDVGELDCELHRTKRIRVAAATNNLHVKILGSMDGGATYDIEVVAEFTVTAGTPQIQTITDYYTHLKVQTKPAVSDTHGTLSTDFAAASF